MRTHIDWLTFTMTMRYESAEDNQESVNEEYARALERAWHTTFDTETLAQAFGGGWEKQEKSRAPYSDSWSAKERGITVFAGISLNHCCVEISGQGCEILIEKNLLHRVLELVRERVTRIDVACDVETETTPIQFVSEVKHKRMRSSGYQKSASGETCYVGSRTSDRYARVYRYSKPHPRAHLLRVEHVFRKEYAKKVAQAYLESGINSVSFASGEVFGWRHPEWKPEKQTPADISVAYVERNMGNTVFWLCTSAAPAFKRLCSNGTIADGAAFLSRYFLSEE